MAEVKWIKICTDIFDDEKILLIENLPEADGIIVLWFKLLCLAGKQNNAGVFMMNDRIAYTEEMLSTIFRRNINTVRLALTTFEQFGMIKRIDDVITIPNWGKHQNLEQLQAFKEHRKAYMNDYRQRQKLLADSVTVSEQSRNCSVTPIDKDKTRLEEDKNTSKAKRFTKPTIEDIKSYCQERNNSVDAQRFYDYYQSNGWKVGKNSMKDWKAAIRTWERNSDDPNQKKGINITQFDV